MPRWLFFSLWWLIYWGYCTYCVGIPISFLGVWWTCQVNELVQCLLFSQLSLRKLLGGRDWAQLTGKGLLLELVLRGGDWAQLTGRVLLLELLLGGGDWAQLTVSGLVLELVMLLRLGAGSRRTTSLDRVDGASRFVLFSIILWFKVRLVVLAFFIQITHLGFIKVDFGNIAIFWIASLSFMPMDTAFLTSVAKSLSLYSLFPTKTNPTQPPNRRTFNSDPSVCTRHFKFGLKDADSQGDKKSMKKIN